VTLRAAKSDGPSGIEEQQFRLLVASVRDYAIFLLDPEGHVRSWNAGAQQIKGYLADEVIGQHISIFYTPEDLAAGKPRALLDAAAAQGRVEDEGWRVRKGGGRFWADVVITALRDSGGRLRGFGKVTRDLTARKDAEDKLRRGEEDLATTLYSIGDGVLAADEKGRVTRINPVAERLTGWSEAEALGRPIEEVFNIVNEQTRQKAANPLSRVLAEGIVVGLANHTALIARDGTERPIADSGAPIRGAGGATRGAVLVFRDVSEEMRAADALRQSEDKLRLMIASIADYAIFMLDPNGRVESWNPGAARITGYREDEIVGVNFSRFFTSEDVARGRPAHELTSAVEQGRFDGEGWRVCKDGTRFWAGVVIAPMRDTAGRLVGFVKTTRDLTQSRNLQEERVRLAQAQEAVRLRDEFLSIASHELRTPLTALQLQLQGARDRASATDAKVVQKLDRATRVGDRLAQLVEALLDVSRIATGRLTLNLEPCDLAEPVREVVEHLADSASSAGCQLTMTASAAIPGRWDRLRIEQVAMNLISNAIKYAAGEPIDVSISRDGDMAVMEVRDQGPGIPEDQLPRIFERFERAASTRHYGGMGLGLYVARQIAEAHGGTITVANLPEGGACFTVRLPLIVPAPSTQPT
jgi:PAS domain S-box-containing protein